ncbi:ubiquitin_carboxyl-terminal hydrolase family protein [Hexamita inflata]|uniref:Ubiquitin carboxyl-terminal hydrolase family protein n=1 Tax=Hexamita inflata TaxID=28002 RepID=A0AA86NL94_9EUKA|nr:ubiquitin carboxyl-terminal hydrolase family protein [Hexamita inflata]
MIFAIVRSLAAVCSGDYKYQDLDGVHCVYACPSGSAADANNKCVCNAATPLISSNQRACISSCHGDEALSADSTRCYLTCPDYFFLNLAKTQCVQACKAGETHVDGGCRCEDDFKLSMDRKSCVKTCPEGQVAKQGVLTDVCACAGATPYISSDMTKCVPDCGAGEFKMLFACVTDCNIKMHNATHCLDSCPAGQVQELVSRTCVDTCPLEQQWRDGFCLCPDGQFRNRHNFCITKCDADEVEDIVERSCVRRCLGGYYDLQGQRCVRKCAPGQVPDMDFDTCVCSSQTKLNLQTFTCDCPANKVILLNNLCGDACPAGSSEVESNGQRQCQCSFFVSSDQTKCVAQCPEGEFMDRTSSLCYSKCPGQLSIDITGGKCVDMCGLVQFSENGKCRCDYGYMLAMTNFKTPSCVKSCSQSQIIVDGQCKCADGTIPDPDNNVCVCPENRVLSSDASQCLVVCPAGRGFITNEYKQCQCPSGKYFSQELFSCMDKCDANQKISVDGHSCVDQCPPRQFTDLFGEKCIESCPDNAMGKYPIRQCKCLSGMISVDGKSCVQQCGVGQLKQYNSTSNQFECKCAKDLILTDGQCLCKDDLSISLDYSLCLDTCPVGQVLVVNAKTKQSYCSCDDFISSDNKTCVKECGVDEKTDLLNKRCSLECYYPLILSTDKKSCVQSCKVGEFDSLKRNECQVTCSAGVINEFNKCECPDFGKISLNGDKCVSECGLGEQTVLFEMLTTCQCMSTFIKKDKVCQCASGYMNLDQISCVDTCPATSTPNVNTGIKQCTCPVFIAEDSQSCVTECVDSLVSFDRKRCTSHCFPNAMDIQQKNCVSTCGENQIKMQFACQCVQNYLRSADLKSCVTTCPFYSISTDFPTCVNTCVFPKAIIPHSDFSDTVPECADSCPSFIMRADQHCYDKCDYLNKTGNVCESNTDKTNCPLLRIVNAQNICVLKCEPNEVNKNGICIVEPPKPPKDNKMIIIVCSTVGGIIGAVLLGVLIFFLIKKFGKGYKKVKADAPETEDVYV